MSALNTTMRIRWRRALRGPLVFAAVLLIVEFLDEFVFGVREAAWPLIRDDLGLSYTQIGLLFSIPNIVSSLTEPIIGVLGDVWKRWVLVTVGGLFYAVSLLLMAVAPNFIWFLLATMLAYPMSGALVSLSQASLMDLDPRRHEQLMARWTLAGSIGVVAGPLMLGAAALAGAGWRLVLLLLAVLTLAVTVAVWRQPRLRAANGHAADGDARAARKALWDGLREAASALRRRAVLRWLVLLQFSDFMLDVLLSFLALYMVDAAGVSPVAAGTAVAVWTGAGLLGDVAIIPVLERVPGVVYLRYSAAVVLFLFPAFLLAPWYPVKLALLALLGICNAGWYAILSGRMYSEMPGRSGTVVAVGAIFGLAVSFTPALLGWVAQQAGITVTMWLLLLGPIALLVGLPRKAPQG